MSVFYVTGYWKEKSLIFAVFSYFPLYAFILAFILSYFHLRLIYFLKSSNAITLYKFCLFECNHLEFLVLKCILQRKIHLNKKCFRIIYAPLMQNSKLLLICTRHYKFRTLYKAEVNIHNQIRVKDYIIMIKWQKKLEFMNH